MPEINPETDLNLKLKTAYEAGYSLGEMSRMFKMSVGAMRNRLVLMGVQMRSRGGPNNTFKIIDALLAGEDAEQVLRILTDKTISIDKKATLLCVHPSTVRSYIKNLKEEVDERTV
jgi:hypothetical protein